MTWLSLQTTDRLIGFAQVILSALYLACYFVLLWVFLAGHINTPPEWRDQLGVLIGILTAGVNLIMGFWFSRSRPQGDTPPPT